MKSNLTSELLTQCCHSPCGAGFSHADLKGVIRPSYGILADKITAESSPKTIENWDSMQHLNLVLAIEEKFGVQPEPEDIEQMKNAAAALVEKLQSAAR